MSISESSQDAFPTDSDTRLPLVTRQYPELPSLATGLYSVARLNKSTRQTTRLRASSSQTTNDMHPHPPRAQPPGASHPHKYQRQPASKLSRGTRGGKPETRRVTNVTVGKTGLSLARARVNVRHIPRTHHVSHLSRPVLPSRCDHIVNLHDVDVVRTDVSVVFACLGLYLRVARRFRLHV